MITTAFISSPRINQSIDRFIFSIQGLAFKNSKTWHSYVSFDVLMSRTTPVRNTCSQIGPRGNRGRIAQEFGTIEARSNEVTTAHGGEWRWPERWNSIRRSKALERIMGKRVKTSSRRVRRPDAINTTFFVTFGNERGSAMVSCRQTRR